LGAREVLDLGQLGGFLRRIISRRRRGSELARLVQDPSLPHRHLRQDRVGAVPFAWACRDAPGPFHIGAVGLAALDDDGGDLTPELETGADIARILDTRQNARAARPFGLLRKIGGAEQVLKRAGYVLPKGSQPRWLMSVIYSKTQTCYTTTRRSLLVLMSLVHRETNVR